MILLLYVILFLTILVFIRKRLNYWSDRRLITPSNIWQETRNILAQRSSMIERWRRIYEEFKSKNVKHGGSMFFLAPIYIPIDLDIVKRILQVDFQHFVDRGLYVNEKGDPLSAHLFSLQGNKWKTLRQKLTPTFTSGKMKMMFPTLLDCTEGLYKIIDNYEGHAVDIRDILARFTTDIIGSCAFGIECNTLQEGDNEFRKNGKAFFETSFLRNLKQLLLATMPTIMLKLNMKILDTEMTKFFLNVVKDTIKYREENKIFRKDFMHLLIQLKNRGMLVDDENLFGSDTTMNAKTITTEEITAQALIFFIAGFETSSTTMTFCLYELAKNKQIQEKLRNEIRTVLEKHDNNLTYDAVMDMAYLEQTINESLRKYPPLAVLFRKCTEDYHVPGTDLIVVKGQKTFIPVVGIHYDPEYYPEPEIFDPDRFSEENRKTRPAFSFLAFGEGPRNCIGLRFGMMQTKVGLIALLLNYDITVSQKTKEPIEYDPTNLITSTKGGMWLKFKKVSPNRIDLRS